MAQVPDSDFDSLASAFADYGTTVRGYVRYAITRRNLKPYISGKKLNILDVGGGSGGDTAWLAEQGHRVTFIEPSIEQRRYAERRFTFMLDEPSRNRIIIGGATPDEHDPEKEQYDLVLVHAVGMYQADAEAFLRQAMQFVKKQGLLSIIEKGYYGTELRNIRDNDMADLARLHKTGRSINSLRQNVQTFKPEQLEAIITAGGFIVEDWSGIRVIADDFRMPADSIDSQWLKQILETEYEQGHHPAIRGQAQLLHFIARRKAH